MTLLCKMGLHKWREFMAPDRMVTAWQCERCGLDKNNSIGTKETTNYTWEEWRQLKEKDYAKKDDPRPETGKWKGSTELTIIDGQHQIISDCGLVNTPSVWVDTDNSWAKEGISPEDRISYAFNLLNAFLGSNHHAIAQQQFVELQRVLNILSDSPSIDEDRQWANESIDMWRDR